MAIIKETGTISVLGEVQSGTSRNGNPWYRQTIVVDVAGYNGSYRKIALQASGREVADLETAKIGDRVEVAYQVTAREYQGRWYNNADLYKIEFPEQQGQPMSQPSAPEYPQNPQFPQNPQVNMQQFVQNGMYPSQPAPAAPVRRGRPAVHSTPQIPAGMPMDLQDDDLPPSFYPQH